MDVTDPSEIAFLALIGLGGEDADLAESWNVALKYMGPGTKAELKVDEVWFDYYLAVIEAVTPGTKREAIEQALRYLDRRV